jgi:spore germination protein (amino acid permease)
MAKNLEQGIINSKQFTWLLFIIITSFTVLQVPGLLIHHAGRDAWLSVVFAWLFDSLYAVVLAYMGIRFPGENYIQCSTTILGKILGKIFGVLFICFFLIVSVIVMRGLSMYIGDVFLPRTPLPVVLLGAYLTIAYIVRKGIEVIARICEILGPVFLLSFVGLFLLALPFIHFERLKPQFDLGVSPFLSGMPMILSYMGICIAMNWYTPICNRPENGFIAKVTALSLGSLLVGLIIIFSISILGVEQAGNITNLGLQLARIIHVGEYFERVEMIWMVIAIGAGIMMAISAVWIFSLSVAQITGLDSYKSLVYPSALLSFFLCLTSFPNNITYLNFTYYIFPVFGLFVETLPLWLFFAALITGKKGGNMEPAS